MSARDTVFTFLETPALPEDRGLMFSPKIALYTEKVRPTAPGFRFRLSVAGAVTCMKSKLGTDKKKHTNEKVALSLR